jgi:tRNA uridine 5-carboxymethylaminomethyl modification enzyme
MLGRPGTRYAELPEARTDLHPVVVEQVEIQARYQGYMDIEARMASRIKALESRQIPHWLDYDAVPSLRTEAREKLKRIRPIDLGQAARVPGISPADVSLLSVLVERGVRAGQ